MKRDQVDSYLAELHDFYKELECKQLDMFNQLVAHLEYHKKHETKWGLIKIMSNHPFRTILAGFAVGVFLALSVGAEIKEWLLVILRFK